ncbi:MAG: metallophosphoesterase [Candidatus Brockarchaeota archaeon]|nr:metallophosphoesterase [Candidatus Brockarchaeota archaeon]
MVDGVLVVSDLHLGFEGELRERGIRIPSQTDRIFGELADMVEKTGASRLVLLGDVKHGVPKVSVEEWRHIPNFLGALSEKVPSLEIVPGNHDGDLLPLTPRKVKIHPPQGLGIGNSWLVHGHALPPPKARDADCLVTGHVHPAVELTDAFGFKMVYPVWLKCKPSGTLPTVVVMPSFNRMIGHLPVNRAGYDERYGPVFNWAKVDIGGSDAYTLDGTLLGQVKDLRG